MDYSLFVGVADVQQRVELASGECSEFWSLASPDGSSLFFIGRVYFF